MRRFFARLASPFRASRIEDELSREIASHLALIQEDFERRGLSPEAAHLAARRAYGGVAQTQELHREARAFPWVEQLFKDLRYGARTLLRAPVFSLVAIVTLALGIGANTAIFSVVNAVLLRPLAYHDADRLVVALHGGSDPVSAANYIDWRDRSRSFQAMAAAEYWSSTLTGANLAGDVPPEHLIGLRITPNLLPMLGVGPLLGRVFAQAEDRKGSEHEVVLSYRLWQRLFNGDPNVLGRPLTLNNQPYTVVGIMPAGFQFAPFWATRAEMWVPLAFGDRVHNRGGNSLRVFARLKPGVTLAQARAEMAAITAHLEREYPGTNRDLVVMPLKEKVVGGIEIPLVTLLCACGFVLLIACANVAHMLLARTSGRRKEIAVRVALGAGRGRVVVQLLTENLLLAALGAAAGLLVATWAIQALVALSPAYIPRVETVAVDLRVVFFLLSLTAITAFTFGLVPALQVSGGNLSDSLKEGGRSGSDGVSRHRLRAFLVASEFALAFMLLVGAGLMIRSFIALQSVDPGFNPHNVLSMVVSVAGSGESETGRRTVFYRQLLERIRALPGVQSASGINHLPIAGDLWGLPFAIEGRPKPLAGESPNAIYRVALPGYFQTMRLPVLRGRAIAEADDARAPGVVMVNERAAAAYWPGQDPVGQRIAFNDPPVWLNVIGVVKNAKQGDWASPPYPEVYLAALQNQEFLGNGESHTAYITLVVRSTGDPAALAPAVKQAVWSFDRNLPVSAVLTMDQVVADATSQPRFEMLLFGLFAALALVLAAVGIYGVMNYAVSRRTREIGIRISLGASRAAVLRMVVRQGMMQALAGTAAGCAGALLLGKLMSKMLYGVQPQDPITFAGVALVLGAVALLASTVPARKATRIEPTTALRAE